MGDPRPALSLFRDGGRNVGVEDGIAGMAQPSLQDRR